MKREILFFGKYKFCSLHIDENCLNVIIFLFHSQWKNFLFGVNYFPTNRIETLMEYMGS